MLGNLLDNACKWARSRVVIESTQVLPEVSNVESGFSRILVTVDDDGPGLAADLRERVLQRGVRADEKASGSGLGLAIVRDLAEVYQGTITLDASPLGGLRATLTIPGAR
jgi:signal transduction histidine kinase